jgi:hypothetical protein
LISAPFWEPDQSFAGLTVTVVGGGPSHTDFHPKLLRDHRLIAVNSSCRHVRPVATEHDFLFFLDHSWAQTRADLIADWPGPAVTTSRLTKIQLGNDVRRIDANDLSRRLNIKPDAFAASSGHAAACLAAIMGAARILLIGFECWAPKGRSHGHGDYKHRNTEIYARRFLPAWTAVASALNRFGVEIVNTTPGSAIPDFPRADLREVLHALDATFQSSNKHGA